MKITEVKVHDVRFPTSKTSAGSDAVHKDPDYSCVYVILKTDSKDKLEGHGLTFSLGRGNELIKACVESLSFLLEGKDFERDIRDNMMDRKTGFYYALTQEGQLRWLGPEKGVLHMACGAILNAVWDLWARLEKKPLWELVADMEPEQLVELIDFKHLTEVVTKEKALQFLRGRRDGWQQRKDRMKKIGFRAYTTSAGWLGYPVDKVKRLCREGLEEGHRYFKMKVGSPDVKDDIKRAKAIRETIGDKNFLMMDANQKWGVEESIANMRLLAPFKPLWIEEPTNCDDILGHAAIAKALKPLDIGVATGEVCHSKVMFKQLLQANAIKYCQIDSCRMAGISELLSVLLMAAIHEVKVCPHAGGVGLCEYVRHLSMIDFVVFNPTDEVDRICESTSELFHHFYDPVAFNKTEDGLFYKAPVAPGYARMKPESLAGYEFPLGSQWLAEPKAQKEAEKRRVAARKLLATPKTNQSFIPFAIGAIVGAAACALYLRKRK